MVGVLAEALSSIEPGGTTPTALADALGHAAVDATYLGRFSEAAGFLDQLDALHQQDPEAAPIRWGWAFAHATFSYIGPPADRLEGDRLMAVAQSAQDETGRPIGVSDPALNILLNAIYYDTADRPELNRVAQDAITRARRVGAVPEELAAHTSLGVCGVMNGDNEAYSRCVESLGRLDQLGGRWVAEWSNLVVGIAAELVGDFQSAGASAQRAMEYFGRSGLRFAFAFAIHGAARFAARVGRPEDALRLWGAASDLESTTGLHRMPLMTRLNTPLQQTSRDTAGAAANALLAEGGILSTRDLIETAQRALFAAQHSHWPDLTTG
jgi:hypothetical protein